MGLINKTVKITWQRKTCSYYKKLGYTFTHIGNEFEVKVKDLLDGCNKNVDVKCDCCGEIKHPTWQHYIQCKHQDNKYYCQKCATKLFQKSKEIQTRIANGKSFYDWCLEHNRFDILLRWDFELNMCSPQDITYRSRGFNKKGYWFKCPREIHPSELKSIDSFINDHKGSVDCIACNSIGQYICDTYGSDKLNYYWDWYNNVNKNGKPLDPFTINRGSNKKIYIYCQEHSYHYSYPVSCNSFINGSRCPYCDGRSGKIHPYDSLGWLYPEVFDVWSEQNKKTPYEYSSHSNKYAYFKCPNNKHEDYKRRIYNATISDFRCPECGYSKGEKQIELWLLNNNFIKIEDDKQLINKNKKCYIPQKEFNGLIGLKGGNLSYDFYLPNYNLLIEYDGEFHYLPLLGEKQLNKQKKHDKLKDEYCINNNIPLLRIPYWDFDNIEKILDKEILKDMSNVVSYQKAI